MSGTKKGTKATPVKKGEVKTLPQEQQEKQPEGIWISNAAWSSVINDLSVFKPIVMDAVAKSINQHGEVR